MNLYLMRHGETYWNLRGCFQGSADVDLTDYGIELAKRTSEGFVKDGIRFDRIYVSPLLRARRTAAAVNAPQKAPLYVDERLREMCFGTYEGKPVHELKMTDRNVQNLLDKPSLYHATVMGEGFADVYARIDDFMEQELMPLEHEPGVENVLAVCHGAVIRVFLTRINGMDLDEFWTIHQPNCCVNLVELKDGHFRSVKENILYYEYDPERFKNRL